MQCAFTGTGGGDRRLAGAFKTAKLAGTGEHALLHRKDHALPCVRDAVDVLVVPVLVRDEFGSDWEPIPD